jgi:DNA helicase HerA-like ATPase
MELSDVQSDVLNIIFHIAEDNDIDLFTIDNLRETIRYITENKDDFTAKYGTMSAQSLGSIQRSLLVLEDLGGEAFFGEPELDIMDWMDDDEPRINILHSVELAHNPTLYGTFLLWMLTKLFEKLPEEGDLEKPKFVFFFDEAHMLFTDAPKALLTKVEQVVKLIRSKGVGIYFISQSPSDIPDKVLSQLSNRIQHGLRAYTPAEQKAVKAAAQAFRANPEFKTEEAILDLGVGEALISCLDEDGRPSVVQRAFVVPPRSYLGALSDAEYKEIIKGSPLYRKYHDTSDNSNTDERIAKLEKAKAKAAPKEEKGSSKKASSSKGTSAKKSSSTKSAAKKTAGKAAGRAVGNAAAVIGREAGKGLIGLFKKKK